MFKLLIQGAVGTRDYRPQHISAFRKDVTANATAAILVGKENCSKKHKSRKEAHEMIGSVSIPQSAFLAVLNQIPTRYSIPSSSLAALVRRRLLDVKLSKPVSPLLAALLSSWIWNRIFFIWITIMKSDQAGLYIHIPFCLSKCGYAAFTF